MTKVKQISIAEAIEGLDPTAGFMYGPGEDISTIVWDDDANSISAENIQAEITRLEADYAAKQYQRDRAAAYPSIADQLDMLYHQGIDGWKAAINAVKEEYPKP